VVYIPLKMREGVKEKDTKVDCWGWAGTKEGCLSSK
jgi:hypothetical protein